MLPMQLRPETGRRVSCMCKDWWHIYIYIFMHVVSFDIQNDVKAEVQVQ